MLAQHRMGPQFAVGRLALARRGTCVRALIAIARSESEALSVAKPSQGIWEEQGMPNKPGNDDRAAVTTDREWQREVSNETGRVQSAGGRRSNRGFASMDPYKQKEIASKGGKAAHAKGTAHEFDSDEAREAGRKGGQAVSRNRDHMAMIGRRGGEARGHARNRSPGSPGGSSGTPDGNIQNTRNTLTDREVGLHGTTSPLSGSASGTAGSRGASGTAYGSDSRLGAGSTERSSSH
jgi:uncharacterized protein